jgi:serine/threonine protein kinase/Tfp pilus assembly protein PilF
MAASVTDLKSIFGKALELSSDSERAAYLDRACQGDAGLRAEVESLLQAREKAGAFLAGSASDPATTCDEPIVERPGALIGPYKLLEQIGEGGFGVVFMAEQQRPLRRKVALKVLKPGMDTRQVVARFEAERQALALMDHPNIARIFDGGETASGRPYFVMELVRGIPITDFCDQSQLPVRERLELFLNVCQAVQHAHQKGVIHRDIKPSNVLVTMHNGTAVVKVIDFGVAKAIGQQLTDKTLFTGFAQMIGTPLYMSPEQAAISAVDVDTRSDIYSLGVLLYELLTGTTPFDKERLHQAGYDEMRRIIREEEPPRPSTRMSTLGQAATTISTQRKSDPKRLSQLFRGELDWIVMKCLEKDRNRRYESASALAADVQRYLSDEPVLACPPSAAYRVRKFARRNKKALAVAGLILFIVGLLGGGGGWVIRDRAARKQRLTAQVELILDDVDALEREQKWPEARAAVERAEAALASGESDDAIKRRIDDARRHVAFVAELDRIRQERAVFVEGELNNAGAARDYAQAFRDYAVDIEALPADESVARLRTRPALTLPIAAALDDWVEARRGLGERASSWKLLIVIARGVDPDPLRDQFRAAWGRPVTPELQAELLRVAKSVDIKAQRPATIIALAHALNRAQLAEAALGMLRDGQYAYPADFWLNFDLAKELHRRSDNAGALRYCSTAVSLRPDSAAAHNNLGFILDAKGCLDEAIQEYQKAIDVDPTHAMAHNNLGSALRDKGKLDEAIAEYRKAMSLGLKLALVHNNLGTALADRGQLDEAIQEYHKAIDVAPTHAKARSNLGSALRDKGQLDNAIEEYKEAIRIDSTYAPAHYNLGVVLAEKGRVDEAITEYQKATELDPKAANAHYNLAIVLSDKGRWNEAIARLQKAVLLDPKSAKTHGALGQAFLTQGRFVEARASTRHSLDLLPRDHPLYKRATWQLQECERLIALEEKLPAILQRKEKPADATEGLALARLCQYYKRLYAASARLYAEAFETKPELANDPATGHRYDAACAAALAGCGQGEDAAKLDNEERARLRRQAMEWLRADLAAWAELLGRDPKQAGTVAKTMQHWQSDADLAGLRDKDALAKLSESETSTCQKLWADVDALLARVKPKAKESPPGKP